MGAQLVVKRSYQQRETLPVKKMQQSQQIRAARNGDQDQRPRLQPTG